MKIYLGGTCNGSTWRDELKKLLDNSISVLDQVVENWTREKEKNNDKKYSADFCAYTITPELNGFLSIANVVDFSNKFPEKCLFCYLSEYGGKKFNAHQLESLRAIGDLIAKNGGKVFTTLEDLAKYLNHKSQ